MKKQVTISFLSGVALTGLLGLWFVSKPVKVPVVQGGALEPRSPAEFQAQLQRIRDIDTRNDKGAVEPIASRPDKLPGQLATAPEGLENLAPFYVRVDALVASQQFEEAFNLIYERRLYLDGERETEVLNYAQEKLSQAEKMLAASGRFQGIVQLYQMVVNLQPDNSWFYLRLTHWLIVSGALPEAEQALSGLANNLEYQEEVQSLRERIALGTQSQGRAAIAVPLQKQGEQFSVLVDIDGASARLMIDTGASMTVVKEAFLEQTGVAEGLELRPLVVNSAGGQVQGFAFATPFLRVGSAIVDDVEVGVMELPNFQYDGLLGMNFLSQFSFYIDQQASLLLLE